MSGVSLNDIAKNLNLSRVTVSMIMNGRAQEWRISEATRLRVLEAAKEMGYRRNANASAMITGKTGVIGYLAPNLGNESSARTMQGLIKEAGDNLYSVIPYVYERPNGLEVALHRLMERRPDALVYRMYSHEELALLRQESLRFNIPLLVHGSAYPMEWGLRVNTDDIAGARMAVEHLLELGHRDIYFLGNPGEKIEFSDSRYRGFQDAMMSAGIATTEQQLIRTDIDGKRLSEQLVSILKSKHRPTALFCMSDNLAAQALGIIRQCGLRVPDDISVVGFANLSIAQYTDPPLTTVMESFEEVGKTIFTLLKSEIESVERVSMKQEIARYVADELIIRQSTQCLSSSFHTNINKETGK